MQPRSPASLLLNDKGKLRLDPRKVYFGWYIVIAGAVNGLVMVGVTTYAFGLFINPLREELGWSVALIATASSIRSFESGLMAPLTGYLVDRLGPRLITGAGIIVMATGLAMFSMVHQVWLFFASAVVIALGQSLAGGSAFNVALVNWFEKKRARAIGLARSGSGLGSLTVPPLIFLISMVGWRNTLVMLAVFVLCVGMVIRMFLKVHPEEMGYLPDGGRIADSPETAAAASKKTQARYGRSSGEGMDVAEALRTPAFFLMALSSSLRSAVHTCWLVLAIAHLQTVGFSAPVIGMLAGGYGLTQFGWRILIAWVGDALGRRRVLLASFALQGIGMAMFASASPERMWLVLGYFVIYGIGNAAWSTMDSTQIADYFGTKRYATLTGLKTSLAIPLGLASPVVAGFVFDTTGTYQVIFTVYAAIIAAGGIGILAVRRPQWKSYAPASVTGMGSVRAGDG